MDWLVVYTVCPMDPIGSWISWFQVSGVNLWGGSVVELT